MRLTGTVGVPGVAVSDGSSVVLSDAAGRYVIEADEAAAFLFVSVPSGFRAGHFYHRIRDGLAFRLESSGAVRDFSFVYVTDMHLDNNKEDRFLTETIAGIRREAPDFVICGGDISIQGGAQDRFVENLCQLEPPCYHCIGNHEVLVGQPDPKAAYKSLFGPTYYSFNYGAFHFVVLDGTTPDPTREGWKNVRGEVGARQLQWLRNDLSLLPAGTPVIVVTHIPLVSTYAERRGLLSPTAEPAWEIVNAGEVLSVLAGHRVACVLQGHMHENEHLTADGIYFVTTGAAAGKWWRGDNPDGAPPGFRVVRISGSQLESEYRCTDRVGGGAEAVMSVSVAAPEERMGRPVRVDVNLFDGMPGRDRVFARAGERPWWELQPIPGVLHQWTGYVPVGEFDTSVVLTVEVRRESGVVAVLQHKLTLAPWSPGH